MNVIKKIVSPVNLDLLFKHTLKHKTTTTHTRSSQHQQAGKSEGKLQSEKHEATNAKATSVSWAFFWQQPGAMSPYVLSYILLNFSKSRIDNASGQTSIYNASTSQGNIEEVGFWSWV